jgi:hypothetical protein
MNETSATLFAAIVAAVAAVVGAVVSAIENRSLQRLQERFVQRQESAQFLRDKISKLYMPVSMHLQITKQLFDRYFESTITEEEKLAIEHAMREHNRAVREALISEFVYLEPDAPAAASTELLEHLTQWETVYRLKYESRTYDGPVFAGIRQFGFRGFPSGADTYFARRTEELRALLHQQTTPTGQ